METEYGQPPPPPGPAATPPPCPPSLAPPVHMPQPADEERTMAMLCHLLGIFTGFLGPMVLWLVRKDQSSFVDHHGRESLNFQITLTLVMLGLGGLTFFLIFLIVGLLLVPVLIAIPFVGLVLEILAAVAAQRGDWHRYPFNIRLV